MKTLLLFILFTLFAIPLFAQSVGFKSGILFPNGMFRSQTGASLSATVKPTIHPFELQISYLQTENRKQIGEATFLIHHQIGVSDIYIVAGFGMAVVEQFPVNGIPKNRRAGVARLHLRLMKDGGVLEIGSRLSRIVGTHASFVSFDFSYGFFIPF